VNGILKLDHWDKTLENKLISQPTNKEVRLVKHTRNKVVIQVIRRRKADVIHFWPVNVELRWVQSVTDKYYNEV
jgi:hypothetical protein